MKIACHSDNTDSNIRLTSERAKSVMNALIANGIAASRLTFEGYGEVHPIRSNNTEEGKAKNRRVAINILVK